MAVLETLAGNVSTMDLEAWRLLHAEVPGPASPTSVRETNGEGSRSLATGDLALRVPSVVVPGDNILLDPDSHRARDGDVHWIHRRLMMFVRWL